MPAPPLYRVDCQVINLSHCTMPAPPHYWVDCQVIESSHLLLTGAHYPASFYSVWLTHHRTRGAQAWHNQATAWTRYCSREWFGLQD